MRRAEQPLPPEANPRYFFYGRSAVAALSPPNHTVLILKIQTVRTHPLRQLVGNVGACERAPETASAIFSACFSGTMRSLLKCIETVFETPRSSIVTP